MNFFKAILFICVLFFGHQNLHAQTKGGLKGGLNSSTIGGDVEDVSSILGIHIGGFLKLKASDYLSLQLELIYSMQGTQYKPDNIKYNYSYINFPVVLKVYPKINRLNGLNFQVGQQIGLLVSGKVSENKGKKDISDQLHDGDFSFIFGMGYELKHIFFDVRYNLGISSSSIIPTGEYSFPNRVFQLSMGVFF